MAEVPREPVEFARMVVRAFHPPEFVVALDGILRGNNYCSHNDLAHRLNLPAKELRMTLNKMVIARLVVCEKRAQKRINFRDDRRPARSVNTEFWFVPLRQVVDAFIYRVYMVTKELEETISKHAEQQSFQCERCKSVYADIDIVQLHTDGVGFVCERFGMIPGRRPSVCGGLIQAMNITGQLKAAETLRSRINTQLQPLRERAEKCLTLEIPGHPLEGADEETWGQIVPENIGVHGEKVDEFGYTPEIAAEIEGTKLPEDDKPALAPVPMDARKEDDTKIPDKPSWFKDSGAGDEDADDDWDKEAAQQNVLSNTSGTAASFGDERDAKAYYEHFLKQAGGIPEEEPAASVAPSAEDAETPATGEAPAEEAPAATGEEMETEVGLGADVMVMVGGKEVKMSEVTEEMKEEMTAEEYEAYFALAKNDDDDDDDDEYE